MANSLNPVHHIPLPGGRFKGDGGSRRLENGVQMPVLTGRKSKRRFRAHWNGNEPDAGGIAVGIGGKVEMEV